MTAKLTQHHWSGWPGAFCLKCGCEDPMEQALADGGYDLESILGNHPEDEPEVKGSWRSPEDEAKVKAQLTCPVRGVLVWNPTDKKWDLTRTEAPAP